MKKLLFTILLALQLDAAYTQAVKLPSITFPIAQDEHIKVMQRNCQWCHSYGYILNQGKQSREFWHKIVIKMRETYHAPITPRDEKIATDYLFKHYGNGKLK